MAKKKSRKKPMASLSSLMKSLGVKAKKVKKNSDGSRTILAGGNRNAVSVWMPKKGRKKLVTAKRWI